MTVLVPMPLLSTLPPAVYDGGEVVNDTLLVLSLATAAAVYSIGVFRLPAQLRSRFGLLTPLCYCAGLALLSVFILPPVENWSDELFSIHMIQHLVLIIFSPLLLTLGRPGLVSLWAFNGPMRKSIAGLPVVSGFKRLEACGPWVITLWILNCAIFAFWHVPGPHTWALQDPFIHALEHISFFITGLLVWQYVFDLSHRFKNRHGERLVFLSTTAFVGALPGALMVLTTRTLYPVYAASSITWGLTPLEDQQIAGLLMWIPVSIVYLSVVGYIFWTWMED